MTLLGLGEREFDLYLDKNSLLRVSSESYGAIGLD
jgi:hypothetical protein